MNYLEIGLKLLLAVSLGGLIGLERESSHKPAGLRTNILICVGATMMIILSGLILQGKEVSGDSTRIATGVIVGIGFIGAGTIIQARGMVIGLTTAATLWVVAGLGLLIGSGYAILAIMFAGVIFITLYILRKWEGPQSRRAFYRYNVKAKASKDVLVPIKRFAMHEGIKFREIIHKKEGDFSYIEFSFPASDEKEQDFSQGLTDIDGIIEIKSE